MEEVAISKETEEKVIPIDVNRKKVVNESKTILNNFINTLIENNEVLKSKITKKQSEIIELYEETGSYNNIMDKVGNISKSSISQKLNDSNYYVIENNRKMIGALIGIYCQVSRGDICGKSQ